MTRFAALALITLPFPLTTCADVRSSVADRATHGTATPKAESVRVVRPRLSPAAAAAVAVYDIDAQATARRGGFFGSMIAAAVEGSTLELRADGTYQGAKEGAIQSAGTWELDGGELTLRQTEESGQPVTDTGKGELDGGGFVVTTRNRGVTLVFRRRGKSSAVAGGL